MVQNIKRSAPATGRVALHDERCKLVWGETLTWRRRIHNFSFRAKESVFSKNYRINMRLGQETALGFLTRLNRRFAPVVARRLFLKKKINTNSVMLKHILFPDLSVIFVGKPVSFNRKV